MNRARNAALLALLWLAPLAVRAQEWRGPAALGVEVKGKPKGSVEGALVILRYQQMEPPGGPRPVLTDAAGRAVVADLAPGVWEVEVSHQDFLSFVALVVLDGGGRKPAVQASFLQASGSSLTPIRVKFMDGGGKTPSASVPLPPEAAERLAKRRPPPPPRPPAEPVENAALGRPTRRAPQPVMPEPELRPLPETARADSAPPPPPTAPEPAAPAAPQPAPAMPEPTPTPASEPSAVIPEPAEPPSPEPAPTTARPTAPPEPEPAPVIPQPTATPEPGPAPDIPEPAEPPGPEPAPEMPEPAAPAAPEPAPAMPAPTAPPAGEPAPAPEPAPATASPVPEPEAPAATPEPLSTAPGPGPEPALPATVLPPPGPLGPTLRTYRDSTCVECRPGEWAISVETVAGPAGAPCADALEADGRELSALLGGSVALELKEIAAPAPQAIAQMESGEPATRAAELLGDGARACRIVAAVIPKAGRFRGLRMEAADTSGVGDCQADRPCPVGRALWIGQPRVSREPSSNVIWGLFVNQAPDRARRARLTVYFAAPNRAWDPPR